MSLINVDVTEEAIPPQKPVDAGTYPIVCTSVKEDTSKAGNPVIRLVFKIDGEPNAQSIFKSLVIPNSNQEPAAHMACGRMVRDYLKALGVEYGPDGFDSSNFLGQSANAILKYLDDEYGTKNEISRFV